MRGDERERYCSKCARSVVNISRLTTAEREALLANPPPGGLCVAYYRRLSGEYVSAAPPLTASESRRVVQWGAIAASAATLATAAHFAPEIAAGMTTSSGPVAEFCANVKYKSQEALYDLGLMKRPVVTMTLGMMICVPPTPPPGTVTPLPPSPVGPATPPETPGTKAPAEATTSLPADKTI